MMTSNWPRRIAAVGLTLAAVAIVAAPAVADLPKAEDILDNYVDVTGGAKKYDGVKNRVATGTVSIAAAGIEGTATIYSAAPNQILNVMEITGIGTVREGYDGEVAWDINPMMGPRIKSGAEAEQVARRARFNAERHWRKVWDTVETIGEADVDGETCYEVTLTPSSGKPETQFYGKDSGLLVKATTTIETQMGEMPVESFFEDYREVDGLKIPHKLTQKVAVQEVIITITKLEHNVDLPGDQFAVPAEIEALTEKATSEG